METDQKIMKRRRVMKEVKKTTPTIKMRHRAVALLLLIIIAFSSASCNFADEPKVSDNDASQVIATTDENTEKVTEEKKYSERSEIPEEKIKEIKKQFDRQIVPEHYVFPAGTYSFESGRLELQTHGMYGEACAVYVKRDSRGVYWEWIGGFEFRYTDTPPYIYCDHKFYELGEALEKNIIYNGDLEIIYESYKNANYDICYKQYVTPTMDSMFYGKAVYVTVQPQYNDKEYTVEDFADIGCVAVEEATREDLEKEPNKICKRWLVHLDRQSKEWVIEAFKILYERDDVFLVQTDSYNEYGVIPNDVDYAKQTELTRIDMHGAWDIQRYAANITVGIIDSGIEMLPELEPNINVELSRSFDPEDSAPFNDTYGDGHGTKVASLIGAKTNNSTGMAGICWEVQMVSLKVGTGKSEIIEAINYATANNISVINCSMGRTGADQYDQLEKDAIENFPGLFICIAGNHSSDIDTVPYYPASYDLSNIIVVGAYNTQDQMTTFSNYGSNSVDLFAPGQSLYVLNNVGVYVDSQGTSFAAPIVTGVVALMLAKYPNFSRGWIKEKLLDSVKSKTSLSGKCVSEGLLQAHRTLCPHDSPEDYEQATPTNHWITCECGYQGYMLHRYDTIGESVSSNEHYAYCVCGASTVQYHTFTEVYYNASQHKLCCECGGYMYSSHSYIKRYASINHNQHTAYCACGDSITENHTRATDMDLGISYCTKCDYKLELWNVKDEYELQ